MSNQGEENSKVSEPSEVKPKQYLQSILVKDDGIQFVDVTDIDWIEAAGNYVKLHCGDRSHMIRASLKKMEKKLHPKKFVRIHKSSMINVEKVKYIQSCNTGDLKAEMECGKTLNVSRNYKVNLERFKI